MGVTVSNKQLSAASISCGGSFNVRLSLAAAPDIMDNPTDMVLILDRSRSMTGSPLASLKEGAKTFIDIIDESTDGTQDGQIGGGSHIGIVSFSTTATQDAQLITSVAALKNTVDALTAGGSTNHADAFTKALQLFNPASTNARVMIMFTDGRTTSGGDANAVATLAKAQGVLIYVIGLVGDGGLDQQAIEDWASDPSSTYVSIAPTEAELVKLFEDLAKNISKPGATNIVLRDQVDSCFRITGLSAPTKGSATQINDTTVEWRIDALGATQPEAATFEFTVRHVGDCSGDVEVNEAITYSDSEGNVVHFPSPEIEIDCGTDVHPEPCPEPVDVEIDGCESAVEYDAGTLALDSLGRMLQLDVTLQRVCPNRRVALAVILSEVDDNGVEYKRGIKTMTIPAHTRATCQDVKLRCIRFVLPEDLDVSGTANEICNARSFRARFIAHYIDHDFDCCDLL